MFGKASLSWMMVASLGLAIGCSKDKPAGESAKPAAPAGISAQSQTAPERSATAPAEAVEVVPDVPAASESIGGTITLAKARQGDVAKGQTMWLIARAAGGRRGPPLAIQRLVVDEFPVPFVVSGRDAMIKGIPFAGSIDLSVRVDKDNNPMTHVQGEVYGEAKSVSVGSTGVDIVLDSVQEETRQLGRPAPAGGLPPGHP